MDLGPWRLKCSLCDGERIVFRAADGKSGYGLITLLICLKCDRA